MFNERGELLIGKLSPQGFTEISRTKLIEPTSDQLRRRGGVCWAHPGLRKRAWIGILLFCDFCSILWSFFASWRWNDGCNGHEGT
jgi:hypothetical protein